MIKLLFFFSTHNVERGRRRSGEAIEFDAFCACAETQTKGSPTPGGRKHGRGDGTRIVAASTTTTTAATTATVASTAAAAADDRGARGAYHGVWRRKA